jgi:hypothetical protein
VGTTNYIGTCSGTPGTFLVPSASEAAWRPLAVSAIVLLLGTAGENKLYNLSNKYGSVTRNKFLTESVTTLK